MIIPSSYEKTPRYKDFKKSTFDKYERKVAAIILNISQCSLKKEDKEILMCKLAEMLKPSGNPITQPN